jgi:hypothetical protein
MITASYLTASTPQDTSVIINPKITHSDPNVNIRRHTIESQPKNGTATLGFGTFVYKPNGTDSFTYVR